MGLGLEMRLGSPDPTSPTPSARLEELGALERLEEVLLLLALGRLAVELVGHLVRVRVRVGVGVRVGVRVRV